MDKALLKQLNFQGFIVGPEEDESNFQNRISLLEVQSTYSSILDAKQSKPLQVESNLFGYKAAWIRCFSKKSLTNFWEPAKTWIYSYQETFVPLIQISRKRNKTFQEEIEHESVHAVRCAFPFSKYEEHFAYMSSLKVIRKVLGPLFEKPFETILFIILCFCPLLVSAICSNYSIVSFAPFIGFLSFQLIRLCIRRKSLQRCFRTISKVFDSSASCEAIALRLTDKEIRLFSRENLDEVSAYISKQKTLRWQQILASYPLNIL